MGRDEKVSIIVIVSSVRTIEAFFKKHIEELCKSYNVLIIANTEDEIVRLGNDLEIKLLRAPIERGISPVKDVLALISVIGFCLKFKPGIVQTISPKAGLVGIVGSWVARVPVRIHWFTGQVWVTKTGITRRILSRIDWLIGKLCTSYLVDSESQKDFLVSNHIIEKEKATVLGSGSVNGVDVERFRPDQEESDRIREELDIGRDEIVLLFLGRLNIDKGILDLVKAFKITREKYKNCKLILVGPDEEDLISRVRNEFGSISDSIKFVDYVTRPETYYRAADIFCLPSYREGFGTAIIEAAACGVPAVATDIYGLRDAVQNGHTGLLSPAGNVEELASSIEKMILDKRFRQQMGANARKRVENKFSQKMMSDNYLEYLAKLQRNENA